eukprot:TRINITY_DN4922_c0_g1_i1.p1 TRINITY_DN4922_c0_g1~~TRINITY_DN4922_c0_g1_i1.p1  ORF type:complete len:146 (-),score=44.89 TRINITY_DN4922_c0_g1_i1:80-517(-)
MCIRDRRRVHGLKNNKVDQMAESEDLNTIFNSFIQPYQERIDKLKAEQAEKDNEISNLKNTIYEMSKTVNQLKKEAPCSMNNSKSPSMAKSTLLSKKDEEEKKSFKAPGKKIAEDKKKLDKFQTCLLYTSPSPRDRQKSRMPSSA